MGLRGTETSISDASNVPIVGAWSHTRTAPQGWPGREPVVSRYRRTSRCPVSLPRTWLSELAGLPSGPQPKRRPRGWDYFFGRGAEAGSGNPKFDHTPLPRTWLVRCWRPSIGGQSTRLLLGGSGDLRGQRAARVAVRWSPVHPWRSARSPQSSHVQMLFLRPCAASRLSSVARIDSFIHLSKGLPLPDCKLSQNGERDKP